MHIGITNEALLFEKSRPGKMGASLPDWCQDVSEQIPQELRRVHDADLPELSEPEVVRHYVRLSQKNFSIDTHFYPLGSCTMKYNPKINEDMAMLPGFSNIHPYVDSDGAQGILEILYNTETYLCALTGMERFSLQPAAGAHGELTGMMMVKAYHKRNNEERRTKVLVPDSSHGTNPASARLYGFDVVQIPSDSRGRVDIEELEKIVDQTTACLMLTNPNTLGLFENEILKIAKLVHSNGGLLYYDGANLNALMGICRPGDMGFDIIHLNLHKTFSTPHGGGGPGSGPVGVSKRLVNFLPTPVIEKNGDEYELSYDMPHSIGRLKTFYGNIGVIIKAYCYMRMLGSNGLRQVSYDAVLNANYCMNALKKYYDVPYDGPCMHEFVLSAKKQIENGVHAIDIAKRLLDYGFHAPTVYFPLIVPEALMIEPTETESKEMLDSFIETMITIAQESSKNPEIVKNAPHNTPVKRCDDVQAARFPNLCYTDE